jgi:hypothetical protein
MRRSGPTPRWLAGALVALCLAVPAPAAAGLVGPQIKNILLSATDRALERLAKPAAFVTDNRVRIGLPAPFTERSTPAGLADQAELTNDLKGSLNQAAGQVAAQAQPVFHAVIARMTVKGSFGIIGKDDGATAYFRQAATSDLRAALRPLVRRAMQRSGAFGYLDTLHSIVDFGPGLPALRERLTDSVTDQILKAIFVYIADEEDDLRDDPLGGVKLFKGL